MKYKIGDVSRILGISRDLLRYYEKKGVVSPQKDKTNDYRYYDTWDINFLIDCLWYKGLGFGIPQIAQMVTNCGHADLVRLLSGRADEISAEIRKQELILERLRQYQSEVLRVEGMLGRCQVERSPELICYLNRFNNDYDNSPELQQLSRSWLDYMPFTQRYFEIPQEGLLGDADDFAWGFSLSSAYAELLEVPLRPPVKRLNAKTCLHSAFQSSGKNAFSPKHLGFMLDYAANHKYQVTGGAMGNLVCSIRDSSGQLTGYFEVWLPIE